MTAREEHAANLDAARTQLEQAQAAFVAAVQAYCEAVLDDFAAVAEDVLEDVEVFDLRTASLNLQRRASIDWAERQTAE